ncbi:hypothetical protein SVA_1791 [Sulfurifustis variabilis]|uniref:Uncharacterized protein n=1 Tax=Sulfurifustis variabilis TaxID=1675686 RepID=A0A1B4V4L7_9GAMM|nr:hypothetical protein [Sulfurifustis variabilis]BAU48345.1 hypothetical protein SVA_1791 [Sulfurifustis variabilis]
MTSPFARWLGAGALASVLIAAAAPSLACPMAQGKQHMHQGGMAMHQGGHAQHGRHGGGMACDHGQGGGRVCMHRGGAAAADPLQAERSEAGAAEPAPAQPSDNR